MLKHRIGIWGTLIAAVLMAAPVTAHQEAQKAPSGHHLHSDPAELSAMRKLRAGGNVLFFRHERTDILRPDNAQIVLADCATQRNLSVAGVANSRETGEHIRHLKIPIGEVLSSPMCRCLETARHAFGKATIEPRLYNWPEKSRTPQDANREFRAMIAQHIKPGVNTVLVGHITGGEAFGVRLREGDALVITRDEKGQPKVLSTIGAHRWGDLVRDDQSQ